MKMKSVRTWLLVCACVLAACGDEGAEAEPAGDLDVEPARLADAAAELAADAGAGPFVAPDAAAEPSERRADAGIDPAAAADASAPAQPAQDAAVVPCMVTLHRDADHDSFGEAAETVVACGTAGFVDNGLDCFDGNSAARPSSAVEWHETDRGDGSFDFDCDGVETQLDDSVAACPSLTDADSHCPPPSAAYKVGDVQQPTDCYDLFRARVDAAPHGWWGQVAACGQVAKYNVKISWSRETSYQCSEPDSVSSQRQTCH